MDEHDEHARQMQWEAEELRHGIEDIIDTNPSKKEWRRLLQELLDNVDARDSLMYLEHVHALEQRIEVLERERIETQNRSRVLTCAYCGHAYPPGTPASNHLLLTEHIKKCSSHPLAGTMAAVTELLAAIDTAAPNRGGTIYPRSWNEIVAARRKLSVP